MRLKIAKNNVCRIVSLHHMLRRWKIRSPFSQSSATPPDVPKGHVAVRVGRNFRRYIVRAGHLNHPAFRDLLTQAEEEYEFSNARLISFPCDESDFEQILRHIISSSPSPPPSSSSKFTNFEESRRSSSCCCCCHAAIQRALQGEALRLPRKFAEKSMW